MKQKVILIFEIIAWIIIYYVIWNNNMSVMDNIVLLIPFTFIFLLMYILLKQK